MRPRERRVLATDHPVTTTAGRPLPLSALLAVQAVRAADATRWLKRRAATAPELPGAAPVE